MILGGPNYVVGLFDDPANPYPGPYQDEAPDHLGLAAIEIGKIMGARVGMDGEKYKQLMKGTFFLDLKGNKAHFAKGETLDSVLYSSKVVDDFQVQNQVYKKSVPYEQYFDPSIVDELSGTGTCPSTGATAARTG